MSQAHPKTRRASGGGRATHAGTGYQNRVAAWFCVRILAESEASPLWNLPANVTLEVLRCETEQPVDDLFVGTSDGGRVFVQVKHKVTLERAEGSDLASAIDQFVRQYLHCRRSSPDAELAESRLEPQNDRLVLVITSGSSLPIGQHLPSILSRLRRPGIAKTLEEAAVNAEERKVASVVKDHLVRSWRTITGGKPEDAAVREFLELVWVQTLDVDEGGDGEQNAKDSLRSSVIQDPSQADAAWSELIRICANCAASQSGTDRLGLHQELLTTGIRLQAPRSYRGDLEELRQHSRATLSALEDLSKIRVGDREVKIVRPVIQSLCDAAEQFSLVVVGDPGAGKSGALYDFVNTLQAENRDFVFLAVDRLEARSLAALAGELRLTHELVEVLEHWTGGSPGFLVIDAFDAARSELSIKTVSSLLSDVLQRAPRWRVIVSIRKFDLRHSAKLQRLFAGQAPAEFKDPEFSSVRHLNIQRLNDDEWLQVPPQSLELATLYVRAGADLRGLLHNPFNLRLAGELLGEGVSVETLSPIETQIGLLERYWEYRVIREDRKADARQAVLRRAVETMVNSRSLRANRADVASDPTASEILHDLLSSHLLSEWQEPSSAQIESSVLTFAHHMLFDYSVARLLLRGLPETLVERLEREVDLPMAIRPSIVMHFQYERMRNDEAFWDASFAVIKSPRIPEIGKLIGPSVAVDWMKGVSSFAPLARGLASHNDATREASQNALRHLTGAILVSTGYSGAALVGEGAPAWAELYDLLSTDLRATTVYSIRPVLFAMCEHPETMTPEQLPLAGRIARRLLQFALAQNETRDTRLVITGLQVVCRTFGSDPVESARLLHCLLEESHVAAYGHEELFWLGQEVDRLINLDPALVEEMYRVTFTFHDYSDERTLMSGSRIVAMTSTRRQNYDMARYVFAGKFKSFLEATPLHATRALFVALQAYCEEHYHSSYRLGLDEQTEEAFDFDGHPAFIRTDFSDVWDHGGASRDDEPVKMLDVFHNYLASISTDPAKAAERRLMVELIVEHNRAAIVWRRLLKIGATAPETLGYEIRSLGWAIPILIGIDTTRLVGGFLSHVFSFLSSEERERVERSILSIPGEFDEVRIEGAIASRNRLLGCLPFDELQTDEAKTIIEQLRVQDRIPANEERGPVSVVTGLYTDRDFLAGQGVPIEENQNSNIQLLSIPVKDFAARHLNGTPTREAVEQVLPDLRFLMQALSTAEADGVHEAQRDLAWGYLADAVETASRCDEVSWDTDDGLFLRSVLIEAAEYPQPIHNPEHDQFFDKHPSWGSPAARIDAAEGVVRLARHESCLNDELCQAIKRLSGDEVPAVRYMIATHLTALYYTAPDLLWELIERFCQQETSRGVLQGLLHGPLMRLAGHHPDRIAGLVHTIFVRIREGEGAAEVRKLCASIFNGLYIWQNNSACSEILTEISRRPANYAEEIHSVLFDLREPLNIGPVNPPDAEKDAVRWRAFGLMENLVRQTRDQLRELEVKNNEATFTSWPPEDQERSSRLARIAESACMEIYFTSGAYKDGEGDGSKVSRDGESRMRYLREAQGTLNLLSDFGYASLTHHLLQTLEYLISFDPADVFLLVGKVVRSGQKDFYQSESLAADLIVGMIERFIAEFRYVLKEREECRAVLIQILDTFVEAGWPSAHRLAYRLEEIFR